MRAVMRAGWERQLEPGVERFFDHDLGPVVVADARRVCPVDTDTLRPSIRHEVSGGVLRVGSDVEYAKYVERGTSRMAAQPYLRPALFTRRSP